jgi:hypothetical protein
MSQQKQIVPNRVLLATAVFAFIASNQKPEDSVLPELVLVIFYALFFVHRHYRRDPKSPKTQLGKIWRSIETRFLNMPESTIEREVRVAKEKQEREVREAQKKHEREAREAQEKHEREAREAQKKQLWIAKLEEIKSQLKMERAERDAREAQEKQERELQEKQKREAAREAFLVQWAAERKEQEAREKQEREEREEREKPEREAHMLRRETERLERIQARRLDRQASTVARRAKGKVMKDKEKELAKLVRLEAAPLDKPSETIADPIPNQSARKRLSRSFPREDISNISDPSPASEGKRVLKTNYAVVRNPKLRKIAIHIHGRNCIVCGFNFDRTFGQELAQGYIEVHHLKGIARGERSTDPEKDLVPLCANCHAMADRLSSRHESPPRSIIELKNLLFPAPFQSQYETPQTDANDDD